MKFDTQKPHILPLAIQSVVDEAPILYQDLDGLDGLALSLASRDATLGRFLEAVLSEIPEREGQSYEIGSHYKDWLEDRTSAHCCTQEISGDGRSLFFIRPGAHASSPVEKARFLIALSDAIDGFILYAGVVAAVGVLCRNGNPGEGLEAVSAAADINPHRLLLMARAAAKSLAEGREPPRQLQNVLGESRYFSERFCPFPFRDINIEGNGDVSVCNSNYITVRLGQVGEGDIASLVNGDTARKIRQSIIDGSYRYCDRLKCDLIRKDLLPLRKETDPGPESIDSNALEINSLERFHHFMHVLVQPDANLSPLLLPAVGSIESFANVLDVNLPSIASLIRGLFVDTRSQAPDDQYRAVRFYEEWFAADDCDDVVLTMGRPFDLAPPMPLVKQRIDTNEQSMSKSDFLLAIAEATQRHQDDPKYAQVYMKTEPALGAYFAVAKFLHKEGRSGEALELVKFQMSRRSHFLLEGARRVLENHRANRPIPPYLEDVLGESDYFKDRFCSLPFSEITVGVDGEVHICCPSYLNVAAGNIRDSSVEAIINSPIAQKVRESIHNGTFEYCNRSACSFITGDQLPTREMVRGNERMRYIVDNRVTVLDSVQRAAIALDKSCNLSCPSCRPHLIIEKGEELDWKMKATEETILPLLKECEVLQMAGYGEFAMSEPCRFILANISREDYPNLKLDLITNGLLFDRSFWNRYPNAHDMIHMVRVSVDGATKETYEKLRRGGRFDRFVKNMEFMANLRREGRLPSLSMLFVYQKDNFREMGQMVDWTKSLGLDGIYFEKILDWSSFESSDEYRENAVHLPDHPLNEEFRHMIDDQRFDLPIVHKDW